VFQLKFFGAPALERDGVPVTGRASQRHRLALLALLALAPGGRSSRAKLIAYLWPESDEEQGRNLLKVATYVLRSALGETALLSSGDELRLNTDFIQVDVAEFETALEQSDYQRAVALYQGPLLDGFFLSGAPEFEHWVDHERGRVAGAYRKALEALADAATSGGDFPKAVEWWKLRAAQEPYDSRVALRLMQAFEANDNMAGALQHAAIHQLMLKEEFGLESAPEVAAMVERLRREPPNEALSLTRKPETVLERHDAAPATVASDSFGPPPAGARVPPAGIRKRWVASIALLSALILGGAVWTVWPITTTDTDRSIVVLPFENLSADPDNEYFSDGLTEEIITRLAAVPGLKVISRTSAMHYKDSKKPLPEIARELRVDHILEGSVRPSDGRVRISAQLIDARVDGHLWAQIYEHKVQDNFQAQEAIAREVVRELELKLAARTRRLLAKQGTRDPETYQLYQRGRYAWNTRTREGHLRAIEYFQRAIERDSSYADAYAGLAHAYGTGFLLNLLVTSEAEAYDRLKWASERALALDDESTEAHVAFAIALKWQRNWPGAEREFLRAIELNPGNAVAHTWYSLLLRGMGRSEEALRESRLAAELDPFGIVSTHNYGSQCYIARDYDCAIEQMHRTLETAPYPGALRGLGLAYAHKGAWTEALASAQKAVELAPERPDILADLAYVQALAGHTEDARATLRRAKAQPLEGFNIARAHIALGEPDSAFAWFEHTNWRWPHRAARDDPALDPLRSDPRFAQLVLRIDREMGIK
jgi:TolB-like protein/DNA-binding SARP family transcriptional activator/Flp pilus assembly protein TadD